MKILGVDPAISTTGYALIEFKNKNIEILDFGCIRTDSKAAFPLRLKEIYDDISKLIEQHQPHAFAIEEVIYSQNIQIALKMGQARGVSLLAAVNFLVPTYEYSPREVKLAVTGNGAANKQQVQRMVTKLLKLSKLPSPYDISDAMAVAICHCHRYRNLR